MYSSDVKVRNELNIFEDGLHTLRQEEEQRLQKTHFVFNPLSAGGRTGQKLESTLNKINTYFGSEYGFSFTKAPHHATVITRQAILNGTELLIVIGGDGTIQEVVNGFFWNGEPLNPDCRLGIISSGTGQGLAQGLRLPKDIDRQLEIIKSGNDYELDLGRITYINAEKPLSTVFPEGQRMFINEFQVGIGVEVVQAVQQKRKRYGGFFAYGFTALAKAFTIKPQTIRVVTDEKIEICSPIIGIVVANGPYTGGGMNLAPNALLNNGLLDVLIIHHQSTLQRLGNFSKIYSGKHLNGKGFSIYQVKKLFLSSKQQLQTEADGELMRGLPCRIDVLPGAIKVRTGNP